MGLRYCDKCGASVDAVREGQARLEAAREAMEKARLGVVQREAKAGSEALDGVRLGAAKDLLKELSDLTRRAADSEKLAAKHLKQAEGLEGRKKYEQALEKYKEAADLYDTHAQKASDAESRLSPLILVREGARVLKEAREAEESGEYEVAFELYVDAAELDEAHQGDLKRAKEVLPLWIALKAVEEEARTQQENIEKHGLAWAVKTHAALLQKAPFAEIEKLARGSSFPQDAAALQEAAAGLRSRLDEIAEGLTQRAADREKLAAKHLKEAVGLEGRKEYEQALEKFKKAATLHDTHSQKASDAESRLRPLILDHTRKEKQLRLKGELAAKYWKKAEEGGRGLPYAVASSKHRKKAEEGGRGDVKLEVTPSEKIEVTPFVSGCRSCLIWYIIIGLFGYWLAFIVDAILYK